MKIKTILAILLIFILGRTVFSAESKDTFTRVSIKTSDSIRYEYRWSDEPPHLTLKFPACDIVGKIINDIPLDETPIKNITVTYYPSRKPYLESRKIKFLTLWLREKTPFRISQSDRHLFVDIKNLSQTVVSKEIEISGTIKVNELASKLSAADRLLASLEMPKGQQIIIKNNNPGARRGDIKWLLLAILSAIYIMWFRPKEWRMLIERLVNTSLPQKPSFNAEKRKWWRHSLLPLKNRIYVKVESPESNTRLDLVPRDIGYGGLSFECSRFKKLKGNLSLSIFLPGAITPVKTIGKVVWQKNLWNLLKRRIGISFISPPEKDWPYINQYIEKQYASLKS